MKTLFNILILIAFVNMAVAETEIVYSSATITLPNDYAVIKRESGDCPGLIVSVKADGIEPELQLRLGDAYSARNLQPAENELVDLEYFERDPKSWFSYNCVVLRRGEYRFVELRYPIENAFFRVKIAKDSDFQKVIAAMKKIRVKLTSGWTLTTTEKDRSFLLLPPK